MWIDGGLDGLAKAKERTVFIVQAATLDDFLGNFKLTVETMVDGIANRRQ